MKFYFKSTNGCPDAVLNLLLQSLIMQKNNKFRSAFAINPVAIATTKFCNYHFCCYCDCLLTQTTQLCSLSFAYPYNLNTSSYFKKIGMNILIE
jgi:hypothetical protein